MPIDVLLYGAAYPNPRLHALSFGDDGTAPSVSNNFIRPSIRAFLYPFQQNNAAVAFTGIIAISFRRISILNTHAIQLIQEWPIVVHRRAFLPEVRRRLQTARPARRSTVEPAHRSTVEKVAENVRSGQPLQQLNNCTVQKVAENNPLAQGLTPYQQANR